MGLVDKSSGAHVPLHAFHGVLCEGPVSTTCMHECTHAMIHAHTHRSTDIKHAHSYMFHSQNPHPPSLCVLHLLQSQSKQLHFINKNLLYNCYRHSIHANYSELSHIFRVGSNRTAMLNLRMPISFRRLMICSRTREVTNPIATTSLSTHLTFNRTGNRNKFNISCRL